MAAEDRAQSAKMTLGLDAVPADQWRRFHIFTAFSQIGVLWLALAAMLVSFAVNLLESGDIERLKELITFVTHQNANTVLVVGGLILAGIVLLSAVMVGLAVLVWRKQSYALVESGVHYRAGILFKKHIHITWDRVQSVEIQQSLFGRIFGFGTVKVESAGNDEDLNLGLLKMRDAAGLRTEVLTVVDQVRSGRAPQLGEPGASRGSAPQLGANLVPGPHAAPGMLAVPDTSGAQATLGMPAAPGGESMLAQPSDPAASLESPLSALPAPSEPLLLDIDDTERDQLVYQLPGGRLVLSRLLSWSFVGALLMVIASILGSAVTAFLAGEGWFAIWIALILAAISWIGSFAKSMFADYGTKIFISTNGIRKRSGLTKIATSTYPPQRIHAVILRRPWLWRALDWWQLDIVKAGTIGDPQALTRIFVPVATRAEMLRILWTIVPGLGTEADAQVLAQALDGRGESEFFVSSPRSARWVAPISWQSRGLALTPNALLVRRRRFGRVVMIVLQDHIQSLHIAAGPIDRRLGLATFSVHLVPGAGSVAATHMARARVWGILEQENELARQARSRGVSESLEQWKERVGMPS